jgi:hybrid cluster-associated redox disulfide protein
MPDITADTLISTVLSSCPGAADVFERHGLGCGSCLAAVMEPLSAVVGAHDVDLDALLQELNGLGADECAAKE